MWGSAGRPLYFKDSCANKSFWYPTGHKSPPNYSVKHLHQKRPLLRGTALHPMLFFQNQEHKKRLCFSASDARNSLTDGSQLLTCHQKQEQSNKIPYSNSSKNYSYPNGFPSIYSVYTIHPASLLWMSFLFILSYLLCCLHCLVSPLLLLLFQFLVCLHQYHVHYLTCSFHPSSF